MVHVATPRPSIGSALGQALGSLGGQQLGRQFANNQEEQQFQKNLGRQRQESQFQQDVLSRALTEAQKIYADQSLTPEQKEIGLFQALRAHPEIAKNLSHSIGERQKSLLPKAPPGGLSGQSVPLEIAQKKAEIKAQYPNATPSELESHFELAGIPPAYITTDIENRRREQELAQKNIEAEKREVSESFKENSDYINKTYDQYEDALRKEAILERLNQLNQSGELSDSGAILMLEQLGFEPEWLKNPANSEYNKLALDLLGGGSLQADYGSRVLASEFKVSQQRVPSLSQTPEGRAQIAQNIQTMLLPAKLKQERMQYYLNKANRQGNETIPHNLRGKILQDIKPQLEQAYDAFKQRNGRYPVKKGTLPDDNAIEKYYYLSDGDEKKALHMMQQDGYNVK